MHVFLMVYPLCMFKAECMKSCSVVSRQVFNIWELIAVWRLLQTVIRGQMYPADRVPRAQQPPPSPKSAGLCPIMRQRA